MMQHHQEALAARALDGVTPVSIDRRFGAVSRAEMLCRLRPQMAAREDPNALHNFQATRPFAVATEVPLVRPLLRRAYQLAIPHSFPVHSRPGGHMRTEIRVVETHLHHIEIKVVPRVLRNESGLRFIHGEMCERVKRARREV